MEPKVKIRFSYEINDRYVFDILDEESGKYLGQYFFKNISHNEKPYFNIATNTTGFVNDSMACITCRQIIDLLRKE